MSDNARRYAHVARFIAETPWHILPGTLETIIEVAAHRIAGGAKFDEAELQARVGDGRGRRDLQMAGSVAVIPIYGVIMPRATLFSEYSGGTSIQGLQATFREVLEDDNVSAIVFDIDSPGGSTDGVTEFAAEIRAARGTKPIVAQANYRAASAAYHLFAQADEGIGSPSGDVGSVGVYAAHDDLSKALAAAGVDRTLISAGKFKTEANPWEPLSDDAREAIQERVDEMYGVFVSDVSKGRRVAIETVRSGFGQGRMVSAKRAVEAGMADRVDTLDATVQRLSRKRSHAPPPPPPPETDLLDDNDGGERTTSFSDDLEVAHRAIDAAVARGESLRVLTATKREQLAHLGERHAQLGERLRALLEQSAAEAEEPAETDQTPDLEAQFLEWQARRRLAEATT